MGTKIAQKAFRWAGMGVLAAASMLQAQQPQADDTWKNTAACAPENGGYTCSRIAFHRVWRHSQTVQVETNPRDRIARSQVEEYLSQAGKTPVADGAPADVLFVLKPVPSPGVNVGPSGEDLAVLSVYLMADGKRGALVWSQTFHDQPDRRWPEVVHATLESFRAEFDRHRKK